MSEDRLREKVRAALDEGKGKSCRICGQSTKRLTADRVGECCITDVMEQEQSTGEEGE